MSDDLRQQRDNLAESLTQLRGRIVCAVRDQRLPESVRDLLVCLLHGQGIDRAIGGVGDPVPTLTSTPGEV